MKLNLATLLAIALLCASLFAARGQEVVRTVPQDPMGVADRYLAAYMALDFEKLAGFLTEESSWQDPTGVEIGADGRPVVGAEAILAHLQRSTQGVENMKLEFSKRFSSGGWVVSIGKFSYELDSRAMGLPKAKMVPFEMDIVVVLETEGEKVLSHTDFTDFSTWTRQLAEGAR